MTKQDSEDELYEGTDIELVPLGSPPSGGIEYGLGIVDKVAGKRVGTYGDCGVVHVEERTPSIDSQEVCV